MDIIVLIVFFVVLAVLAIVFCFLMSSRSEIKRLKGVIKGNECQISCYKHVLYSLDGADYKSTRGALESDDARYVLSLEYLEQLSQMRLYSEIMATMKNVAEGNGGPDGLDYLEFLLDSAGLTWSKFSEFANEKQVLKGHLPYVEKAYSNSKLRHGAYMRRLESAQGVKEERTAFNA